MFRSKTVNIIIDGISLNVPETIFNVLPTSRTMKDSNIYKTGRNVDVTYEMLEPLILELLTDMNGRFIEDHQEHWQYYAKFLHKYVDHERTEYINDCRKNLLESCVHQDFHDYLEKLMEERLGGDFLIYDNPDKNGIIEEDIFNGDTYINLRGFGIKVVEMTIGKNIDELFDEFIESSDKYCIEEFDVLNVEKNKNCWTTMDDKRLPNQRPKKAKRGKVDPTISEDEDEDETYDAKRGYNRKK